MELCPTSAEVVLRLVLATLLGAVLGVEREWQGKPAGLRTHTLVCIGSATFTLISIDLFCRVAESSSGVAGMDPIRIVEGLVGGIGFLGAGSIIQSRGNVEGLTTASCLWFVGIGIAVGGGHYVIAGVSVTIGLLVVLGLGWLEKKLGSRRRRQRADGTQGLGTSDERSQ